MQRETIRHLCRRAQQRTDILFRWASQRPSVVLELLAAAVGLRYRLPISPDNFWGVAVTVPMTEVMLVFYEGRIEHWLRFGTEDCERILDRRRRIISFAAGKIFAFVRWEANEYGTVLSRLDILRAPNAGEIVATVPGVTPGGEILLRLASWPRVKRAFDAIAQIEARGIDPTAVAPDWWRHLHNRITCNLPYRAYTRDQHAAWQRRRRVVG